MNEDLVRGNEFIANYFSDEPSDNNLVVTPTPLKPFDASLIRNQWKDPILSAKFAVKNLEDITREGKMATPIFSDAEKVLDSQLYLVHCSVGDIMVLRMHDDSCDFCC